MDFAAAPLQALFLQNAQLDQIHSYITQLDQRFRETAQDEKERFGTLQILLPTFKAYVQRLEAHDKQDECLSTFLRPLMLASFSSDSMIATESVSLLTDAVVYWITYSFMNGNKPTTEKTESQANDSLGEAAEPSELFKDKQFGTSALISLLAPLLVVMENEPDFVDLHPMRFIDNWMQASNTEGVQAWHTLKTHVRSLQKKAESTRSRVAILQEEDMDDGASLISSTTFNTATTSSNRSASGMLDLECCSEVMSRLIHHLYEECVDSDASMAAQERMDGWMDCVMAISVAMLACTDTHIRSKLTNEVMPKLFHWQQAFSAKHPERHKGKRKHWCEMLWKRTLEIYGLPATNLLRSEVYGFIAKFFDAYFGQDAAQGATETVVPLDLRFDEAFFKILQSGLRSDESLYRKYASYILKRVIDFTNKRPELLPSNQDKWTPLFKWSLDSSKVYAELWEDWFLLYDMMHEPVIHLVAPVLPRFETLLTNADLHLDSSWWVLLFYRGFHNDTISVKKGILEYIFGLQNQSSLRIMGRHHDFIFGALLKTVDLASLYTVPTQGTMVSPFGEKLKTFIINLIAAFDKDEKARILKQMIHHLAYVVGCFIPILYIMEAVAQTEKMDAWGPDELKSLRHLVDRHRNFHLAKARRYLRKLSVYALTSVTDVKALSFSDLAKTVSSLFNEVPMDVQADTCVRIYKWLQTVVSKDEDLSDILNQLKERTEIFVCDSTEDEIPITIWQNQANVLARMAVFVVTKDSRVQPERVTALFGTLTSRLSSAESTKRDFERWLVLFNVLWDVFSQYFAKTNDTDIPSLIGFSDLGSLLERVNSLYLNADGENETDPEVVELFVSVSRRILIESPSIDKDIRVEMIKSHHARSVDLLLSLSRGAVETNKELSKLGCLRLLRVVYDAASKSSVTDLDYSETVISLVQRCQVKKTPEALRIRKWGDTVAMLIRYKWECITSIIQYARQMSNEDHKNENAPFDAKAIFDEAVEELESAPNLCAAAVMDSIQELIALPWEKSADMVQTCVNYAMDIANENMTHSKASPVLLKSLIGMIFQKDVLARPELNQEDGPVKKALNFILETGELKSHVVAQCAKQLHAYWSAFTDASDQAMQQYTKEIVKLLIFGPIRDKDDQKIVASIALKMADDELLSKIEGTAEIVQNQDDYVVRVLMNDLILRMDESKDQHVALAYNLLDLLLDETMDEKYHEFQYMSTIGHRVKLRIWCTIMLLLRFIKADKIDYYLGRICDVMKKETVISVRCYMEWAMARLFLHFPDRLSYLYSILETTDLKPHFAVSILTVTFGLGDTLDDDNAKAYFEELFPLLAPWLTTNHFTIRLYAYCAWWRNWDSCQNRGLNPDLANNRYIKSLIRFMNNYVDGTRFIEKINAQFYMSHFDPVKDYNIEFIFRDMMTVFDVIDNEKIASRSFIKINPEPVAHCPFKNAERVNLFCASYNTKQQEELEQETAEVAPETPLEDVSYQKKIMPWEMMMETDVDLTKPLVEKKRQRNDIIVVASLVDRIPNLAGLCRTCEIFNASLLTLHSIKVKDDPVFTNISVASERWMPMIEVGEPDVPQFLLEKKRQGYVLCGLEQTTTSTTLGEFDFPERCVLLLGREREGIPANLLQMLDQTIEIPQQGITRSLNVHVSGAICLYEYSKQMQWRRHEQALSPSMSSGLPSN